MELVNLQEILADAYHRRYAVGAFNASNMEVIRGVLEAAEELRAPVIVQAAESEVRYAGYECFVAMIKTLGKRKRVMVAIHLDHGQSFEAAARCIQLGFTSVMIDGSRLPYAENLSVTKKVVELAHVVGVSVEGELGRVGSTDDLETSRTENLLTEPHDAAEFVAQTGVDCFAPAFGTAHGLYTREPKLDFDRLARMGKAIRIPLAMHGGTGVPADQVARAIGLGVAKINFSTILRKSFIDRLREYLAANPDDLMIMNCLSEAEKAMKNSVAEMIRMCGADGRSP